MIPFPIQPGLPLSTHRPVLTSHPVRGVTGHTKMGVCSVGAHSPLRPALCGHQGGAHGGERGKDRREAALPQIWSPEASHTPVPPVIAPAVQFAFLANGGPHPTVARAGGRKPWASHKRAPRHTRINGCSHPGTLQTEARTRGEQLASDRTAGPAQARTCSGEPLAGCQGHQQGVVSS